MPAVESRGRSARKEAILYLLVGVVNTAVGYAIFAAFNFLFQSFRYGYFYASVLANVLAISAAFVNYKTIVFRTKGNALREYSRFYLVYGAAIAIHLALLTALVEIGGMNSYVAALALIPMVAAISFFGHKFISFRQPG